MNLEQIQEAINNLPDDQRGLISDGYHTFNELYEHRCMLAVGLANMATSEFFVYSPFEQVFKAHKHHDGTGYDGWFLLCFITKKGEQISYHLPDKYWGRLMCPAHHRSPIPFDGHTSDDVLERLKQLFCEG